MADIAGLIERVRPGWTISFTYWPPSEFDPGWTRCTLGGPGYISDDTTSDTFEETVEGSKPMFAEALLAALNREYRLRRKMEKTRAG